MAEPALVVDPRPPRAIRLGLGLTLAGVWLAAVDALTDATILIWLVTGALHWEDLSELWLVTGVRLLGYAVAIVGTLALRRRVLRREDKPRLGLVVLLFGFFGGGFVNLGLSWYALLSAALGGELGQPLPVWINNLALVSMAVDVVLMALALVAAVALLVGWRWTGSESAPRR